MRDAADTDNLDAIYKQDKGRYFKEIIFRPKDNFGKLRAAFMEDWAHERDENDYEQSSIIELLEKLFTRAMEPSCSVSAGCSVTKNPRIEISVNHHGSIEEVTVAPVKVSQKVQASGGSGSLLVPGPPCRRSRLPGAGRDGQQRHQLEQLRRAPGGHHPP